MFAIFQRVLVLITASWIFTSSYSLKAQTPVARYGQLSVKGNRIVDKNGNPVQLKGMSLYWSQWKPAFYNANCIKWLKDDWCVSVVRAAMAVNSGGLATNPNEKQKVFTVIDACIANGIYVIVDYHDHTANTSLALAQSFFDEVSKKYANVPNILYEPWNEPLQVSWPNVIKPYHQSIVNTIRKNDPDNIIICGTANWSQKVGDPASDPVSGSNIAYTLHYYAASHKQWLRDAATAAMNKGIALFVTEYGTCEASGNGVLDDVESKTWWDFLEKNFIGHCNWSAADLGETSATLKTGTNANGNWPVSALKPSGILVRDYLRSKCTGSVNSIEEERNTDQQVFYPNPFQHTFLIKSQGNFEYVIYDITGSSVENGKSTDQVEAGKNLQPGAYLLRIRNQYSSQFAKLNKSGF